MYSGYYSRSRRQPPEPEKSQSQYQWRTRVNTLMNTSDEPRESKLTSSSRNYLDKTSNYESPRDSTVQIRGYNRMSASRWMRDDKEIENKHALRDEIRRERFSRTKSDDHLKARGVRFMSDGIPTTSKSLDGEDEDESMPFSRLRTREKRHYRRDWNSDDDADNKSPRRNNKSYDEADSTDNEGSEYGACGGSFDSGLDLRISCSPDDKEYDGNDNNSVRSPSFSSVSNESLRSKSQEQSSAQPSDLSPTTNTSNPIPCASASNISASGAVPKRQGLQSYLQNLPETETNPLDTGTWRGFERHNITSSSRSKKMAEYDYSNSYPPREGISDHHFRTNIREDENEIDKTDNIYESMRGVENEKRFEKRTVDEIPGFSFFSDNSDYMEDIIQKVIDAEENENKDDTKEIERLSDELMFPDNEDKRSENCRTETESNEFEHRLTKETPFRLQPSYGERKRSSSLPPRIEDNEDDLTELLFRSWKLKSRQVEERQNSREEGKDDEWACVPAVFLEDVFTFLTPKERHQASQVCRFWYDLFYSPRVWETFILLERTLTKKRFNLYKGYQRELCPWKTQICLKRVGSFFKRIVITPITDYFNLCEFLRVLAAFLEYQVNQGETPMPLLHTFDFTFACATRNSDGLLVHGTGGQILDMIVKLLTQMTNLKHLKVNQLLTDINEVPDVFMALTKCFCECLSSLEMLNVTKIPYAITELAQFRNLIKLTVSPQHIDDEVIVLLAGLNLLQLHLHQDIYTCECVPVHSEAWKLVKEMAPWLQVYLEISGTTRRNLLIQPRAPVYGVFFRTPYSRLSNELVSTIVEHYSKTLRYVVQEHLPRTHGPRGFDKRCDSSLLFLIRRCQKLHTLVVAERLSTSTLILLATEGKSLKTILVRQNGLIKRCDWPSCGELSREFYSRLKENALDYEKCTNEICNILKRRWRPLNDRQFMRLKIVPRVDMY